MQSLLPFLLLLPLCSVSFFLSPSLFGFHRFSLPPSDVLLVSLAVHLFLPNCLLATHRAMMKAWERTTERAVVRMMRMILRVSWPLLGQSRGLLACIRIWLQRLCRLMRCGLLLTR